MPFVEVCIADDVVYPIIAPAADIQSKIQAVAELILDIYMQHNMRLNFKPNKTAVMITHNGDGKHEAERQLFAQDGAAIPIECRAVGGPRRVEHLHVVQSYIHVGTGSVCGPHIGPEVARRSNIIRGATKPSVKHVFNNKLMPRELRTTLAQTLVMTKGDYNSSTWPLMPKYASTRYNYASLTLYRHIAGCQRWNQEERATDLAV